MLCRLLDIRPAATELGGTAKPWGRSSRAASATRFHFRYVDILVTSTQVATGWQKRNAAAFAARKDARTFTRCTELILLMYVIPVGMPGVVTTDHPTFDLLEVRTTAASLAPRARWARGLLAQALPQGYHTCCLTNGVR